MVLKKTAHDINALFDILDNLCRLYALLIEGHDASLFLRCEFLQQGNAVGKLVSKVGQDHTEKKGVD